MVTRNKEHSFRVGDRVVLARPDEEDRNKGLSENMPGIVARIGPPTAMVQINLAAGLDPDPEGVVLVRFDNYDDGVDSVDGDGTQSYRHIYARQLEKAA